MNRTVGFLRLIRPVNGLMMGFAVIVGAWLALGGQLSTPITFRLLLGCVTAFTLTSASMAINDYCDYEIDKINEPRRPIPSGLVKPSEGLIVAAFFIIVGLAVAALTNLPSYEPACVAVISLVVSVAYVTRGKRTGLPGNLLVSLCVAIPFVYGSLVVGQSLSVKLLLFSSLAFLSNTGREVAKGIVDVEGDRAEKMMTVAVSHGEEAAAYVASSFFLLAVILSITPILLGLVSMWFVPFVAVADVGFAASSAMLIRRPSRENAKMIKNLVLLWMTFGMLSFFAGGV